MIPLNYGVGNRNYETSISAEGESASEWRSNKTGGKSKIRDIAEVGKELGFDKLRIDLLHINCEGCEYAVLEGFITNGWMKNVNMLNLGTHRLGGTPEFIHERYCRIQQRLSETHNRGDWLPWAWERWTLK